MVTVEELREIINDPDIPPGTPIRVVTQHGVSTWEWHLDGAHATLAGDAPHVTLELVAELGR